ncbi:MDR family MFS transporter [Paenibacillus roseipurpureus]|uniref:MDR family MFS transporter n=1 Tax=Paenibacillus roseopurpureus TaxID=2918901 RepID=A0AA96LUH0_9BACL|nr:MDR family MFS transporter [Paenibacillus sp. MBLB1832]WNR46243.1 MDR family MFS transporter [Paenibacillus sp. MBLB1832]
MSQTAVHGGGTEPEFKLTSILVPLIAIITGIFMVILDTTAMNVALSKLVVDFKTDLPTIQWAVTGYMLASAAVIPLAGWLSDRFGAKNVFLTSVLLFTIASLLCATPNSAEMLIAFRILQGLGGGFVMPVAMAYVYRLSPPNKIGQVMGMLGVPILLAPAIGPILSGWLVEYHSWHWIFLINLPVGIFSFIFGLWKLPVVARKKVAGFDLPGMILGPIAFASLSYGITQGASGWTSDKALGGIIFGALALLVFVIIELRTKIPLLELRVFKSFDFSFSIFIQWVIQFCMFGAIFLLPQFLQQARGYGAFDTGLTLFPQAIASAIMMPVGGYLFDKIGVRWLVVIGLSLVSGAIFQYSHMTLLTERTDLILPLAMAGSGMGLMMMPINSHLIQKAPQDLVSRVTSLTSAMQQVISSFGVAIVVTILTSRVTTMITEQKLPVGTPADMHKSMLAVAPDAFGYTFKVMMIIAMCGIVLGFFVRRGKQAAHPEARADVALEGLH